MSTRRKRARMDGGAPEQAALPAVASGPEDSLLSQVRNMEEFAALGQFLFLFGTQALKLPDFSIEELEVEVLDPRSGLVTQILQSLVKLVSSDSRLVAEQLDHCIRKLYLRWKPVGNPFGNESVAKSFAEMDLFTRIRILHRISVWTFTRPNLIRDKMGNVDMTEEMSWRMDPCGYDSKDHTYYILDDNRLYRRGPINLSSPTRKVKPKPKRKSTKRRRVSTTSGGQKGDEDEDEDEVAMSEIPVASWQCVCVSLQDWEDFVHGLKDSKGEDEKALRTYLGNEVLPELRKVEDGRRKALLDREKARAKEAAVANRKRSSRIDSKMARKREEEEKAAEEYKQAALLKKAAIEQRMKHKQREARMAERDKKRARDQRFRERESKSGATSGNDSSVSGRRSSARVKRNKSVEDEWVFDCECGVYGQHHAAGSRILSCDRCDVWQHLDCQNLPPGFVEGDFICKRCKRIEESKTIIVYNNTEFRNGASCFSSPGPGEQQEIGNSPQLVTNGRAPNGLGSASEPTFQTQIPNDGEHILGASSIAAHEPSSTAPRPVQQTPASGHAQDAKIASRVGGGDAYGNGNAARNAAHTSPSAPAAVGLSTPNPQTSGSWTITAQMPATNGVQKPTPLVALADGRPPPHYPPSISWPTNGLPGTAAAGGIPTNSGRTHSPLGPATDGSDGKEHGLYLAPNVVAGPAPSANP